MGIKFGTKQLKQPTPHNVGMLFDFLAGVAGILSGYVTTAAFISHNVSDVVSSILSSLVIPLLLLGKRFFGVEVGGDEVPVNSVSEMDAKPDK